MRPCAICIKCLDCSKRPELLVFWSEPPIKFAHFPALLHAQNTFYGAAAGDPEFYQPRQNHQQNFRKSLSQKYPNSFSQNTKDHLHFPGSDCTKFSNSATTMIAVVCATEQRPLPCRGGGRGLYSTPGPCIQSFTWSS
jgi:hypothetical protein